MSFAIPRPSAHAALDAARSVLFGPLACESVGRADRRIEAAAPGDSLASAASRMWWRKMGAMLVVDNGSLVGTLAEDDVMLTLAERLREHAEEVDAAGDRLVIWESVLADATVADAMTVAGDAAVVEAGASLLAGIEATFGPTSRRRRKSYIYVVDAKGAPMRVISFRDIARYLIQLYDDHFDAGLFADHASFARAQRLAWQLLDLSIGWLRDNEQLGVAPHPLDAGAGGAETVACLADRARGYATVHAPDGTLRGICTRRDVLRALKNPFVRLEELRAARIASERVKTVSSIDTLCGLFKMMAIDGFRHMPLVNGDDPPERVISIWHGVGLLAHRPGEGH